MRLHLIAVVTLSAFWIQARPAFEPAQPETMTAGSTFTNAWADIDTDGDLDLFVGFNGPSNRLYRNDGGRLTDIAAAAGVADARPTRAAAWGDYDADGDPDLFLGFAPGDQNVVRLYRNDKGRFSDATAVLGFESKTVAVRQPVWIDVDGDADLDLFIAFRDRPNALLLNDRGSFRDVAGDMGLADTRRTVGAVWFDYDEDGDLDAATANMDGDGNGLFQNTRGVFRDVAAEAGVQWGGRAPADPGNGTVRVCAGDVNNDGRFDLFTANYGPNGLFLNRGQGRFEDVSSAWGIAIDGRYDSCAFADFDHDGRLDLYVNGTVTGGRSYPDTLFRNTGTGFEDVTPDAVRNAVSDHGVQWADFDRDGDLDLALTGMAAEPIPLLLRNMLSGSAAARTVAIRVLDADGRATAAGAEVRLYAAGTRNLLGARLVDSGSGYDSQNDMFVSFGLARPGSVDVELIFPRSGNRRPKRVPGITTAVSPRSIRLNR